MAAGCLDGSSTAARRPGNILAGENLWRKVRRRHFGKRLLKCNSLRKLKRMGFLVQAQMFVGKRLAAAVVEQE